MKAGFIILIFIITWFDLSSQNPEGDTIKLQEVIVTAARADRKLASAMPVQSVSGMDLEYIAGNSVAGVINTFSGVTLKDYGGIGGLKTVMIRSLGANHTGVFIDGVQLTDVASGQLDLGKITMENTSDVTLYVGHAIDLSQPARFYASANVINISSSIPDFSSKTFYLKTGIKTGSFGLIKPMLSFQKKLNDKSYAEFSLSYTRANGEYPFSIRYGIASDTILKRENSDINALNANASFTWLFSERSQLSLKLFYHDSERGIPGAVVYYNPYSVQRLWNKDLVTGIQYKNSLNNRLSIVSHLKFGHNWLRYLDPGFPNSQGKIDNKYIQQEYYASQVLKYRISDSLSVSLAGDLFLNTLETDQYLHQDPERYTFLSALAMRYGFKRFEAHGNLLASYIAERVLTKETLSSRRKLNSSFALSYKVIRSGRLRLNFLYKDIFRMPGFNELYYNIVGNSKLRPENATQHNLGISAHYDNGVFSRISLKSNIFYNRVYDKIIAFPTRNLFVWSMQNLGKADIRGIELQTEFQTKSFLGDFRYSLNANYTYQNAIDVTKEGSPVYKQQIPYIPLETFSARSSLVYRDLAFGYSVLFNGFRYSLGENIFENMLPSWWLSDLSLIYDFDQHRYTLRLKGEITNIFNMQYEVVRSFPMPGRGYNLTLTLNY
jgi:outer membrane cobalamin receptor